MVIVLTGVGIIAGAFLASVGIYTKEQIALNKQKEIEKAIAIVVPGTHSSEKIYEEKDLSVFIDRDEEGKLIGYAILASGVGFQDKITLMYGTNPEITKITSLTILEQKETPGLGAKITDKDSFLVFWENRDCTSPLSLRSPPAASPEELSPSEVNTITGATISSESVLHIVSDSLEKLKLLKGEGKLESISE